MGGNLPRPGYLHPWGASCPEAASPPWGKLPRVGGKIPGVRKMLKIYQALQYIKEYILPFSEDNNIDRITFRICRRSTDVKITEQNTCKLFDICSMENVLKYRTLYSILFVSKFCFFMQLFLNMLSGMPISVDTNQTASTEAV